MQVFQIRTVLPFSDEAVWSAITLSTKVDKSAENAIFSPFCGQLINITCVQLCHRTMAVFSSLGGNKVIHFQLVDNGYLSTDVTLRLELPRVHWYHIPQRIYNAVTVPRKLWIILKIIHKNAKSAQFYIDHRNRWPYDP